ncbi:MAG TPA: hypothetical protein IAA29_00645 [Candidatus Paenibacillus intestinavium]|nr:hypothetical protein [Candidatus Paenibacillus intestinavium]
MAISITKNQKRAYEMIKNNPNSEKFKLAMLLEAPKVAVTMLINVLLEKEMIVQKKGEIDFEYTALDVEYEVNANQKYRKIPKYIKESESEKVDELLDLQYTFKFTEAQIKIIKSNKGMPRSQLAKKLGIRKFDLNAGLHRIKETR